MTRPALTAALLLGLATLAAQAQDAPKKKLYCWDEGGRRVCGDALPSSAVDAARTEFDAKNGLATSRIGRAPTADERAAAEAQAKAEAEAAAAAEAQHRRFMAMVTTFATEDDLRRAFDTRLSLNRDGVKTARMAIDGLRQSLVALLRRAGEAELNKRPVPKKLADDIRTQHAQLLGQQHMLGVLERDAQTIRAQLDEAVARYRELKPQATAPASQG